MDDLDKQILETLDTINDNLIEIRLKIEAVLNHPALNTDSDRKEKQLLTD